MSAPTREEVEISEKTLDALVLICSAHPNNTYYTNLRNQLHKQLITDKNKFFNFNRYGCSSDIDGGITLLVMHGYLTSCSQNMHKTNQILYNELKRIIKKENYFSDDQKENLLEIGRRLRINEFYSQTSINIKAQTQRFAQSD